jgi:hypothetical protein
VFSRDGCVCTLKSDLAKMEDFLPSLYFNLLAPEFDI